MVFLLLQVKVRDGWSRLRVERSDSTSMNGEVFNYFHVCFEWFWCNDEQYLIGWWLYCENLTLFTFIQSNTDYGKTQLRKVCYVNFVYAVQSRLKAVAQPRLWTAWKEVMGKVIHRELASQEPMTLGNHYDVCIFPLLPVGCLIRL